MATNTTFRQYLQSAFTEGSLSTDEVIEFVMPIFEEVLSFHENNKVGAFEKVDNIIVTNGRLDIDENFTHLPSRNLSALQKLLDHEHVRGFSVTERIRIDEDVSNSNVLVSNLEVQVNPNEPLTHPVYLPGYGCYELKLGHHDAQTDIFCLGLILGSMVMGLDLYDTEDLVDFANHREQPIILNNRMHPTICGLVTEMTALRRSDRSRDLQEIVLRLKYYRDYDPQRSEDLTKIAAFQTQKPADRKSFILGKLRNRLFDTSRRNRLLYYKANSRFVNLTVSSVPMVLHYQSINPQLLFTWNKEISEHITAQKDVALNKFLRFEDHPYLNSQLNSIRQQSENDKKEYGFSQLKLVVAFLQWHNLKETINERIQSPLLLLPVELDRKKSLKEEKFTLKIIDNTVLINPILANHLKELYGIILPVSIDFDEVSMQQFFGMLENQINAAKQGVKLNFIDKPRIKLVHHVARQTINNYRKKLKLKHTPSIHQVDYSYSEENYKPLGLELFRQKVETRQSALEFLLSDMPATRTAHFAEAKETHTKSTFEIADAESNPYSWDFDICNIVLGNFNYKKMSLVSDYNTITEERIEHPVFSELFNNTPRQVAQHVQHNDPSQWFHVINADPTQAKAVLHSRTGKSYIIQGPPGTGKSQTIANLIADFLATGKTVLFVCEKRAALDVVYHRLQQNQLDELCCYIHDSQSDKKEFIRELRKVYNDFLTNRMDVVAIRAQRDQVLAQLLNSIHQLQTYHAQQRNIDPEAGTSIRKLLEKLIEIKTHIPELHPLTQETVPSYNKWLQFGDIVSQLGEALDETGSESALASHPFSSLGVAVIESDNPVTLLRDLTSQCNASIEQLISIIKQNEIPDAHSSKFDQIKNLIQDSVILEPLARSKNLKLVQTSNEESVIFERQYKAYKEIQIAHDQAVDNNKKWVNKFDKTETAQALTLAMKHEGSFFSFLNGSWRRLKKQLEMAYDFSSHQIKPAYTAILTNLQEEYAITERLQQHKSELEKNYNIENIDTIYLGIEVLRRKQGDKEIDFLLQHANADELVLQLSKLSNIFSELETKLKQCLYSYADKSLLQVKDELDTIQRNAFVLKDLLPHLQQFAGLPDQLQQFLRNTPVTPVQAEAAMAHKTLQSHYGKNRSFAGFDHKMIQESVKDIEKYYKELLKLNGEFIRAERRQQFIKNYELSNTSVTQLNPEEKRLKKEYTDGRRILEHEMGKSMRYKSIRELASNNSGKVLKDIKPVWLMSPLSVSDSLPLNINFFDVVIFDEASQITLEEGIPALFRAPQTIIVGDDKQMPPSNFFNTKVEDPEDLETIDGEAEDEILSADSDSLLVQGSRKLDNTMLSWHYRSRYETLISYSNHAFYEASLLTIPDNTIHQHTKPLLEINQPEEGTNTTEYLLTGSMSFHYLPNSVYENRSNIGEAKYIANMIRKLLLDNVQESIGIVAFSQEQQGIIEDAINELAAVDKIFEEVLEKAYNRKDDAQFTGLFIKNLENVQGDERDIIIMSVCYGHDSNKKMLMNFGPINRKGGEKRLNVIFSRAKQHMAIVSSIRAQHITNEYNDGANYLKRFLQYAEMISTGNVTAARTILDSLTRDEKQKSKPNDILSVTSQQIKNALEQKGYIVDERIGQSNFKCNLGVKKSVIDQKYSLGILIDDEFHYYNDDLVEQYYQRPSILKSFGWQILNVYAKDWLEDPDKVMHLLIRKLEGHNDVSPVVSGQLKLPPKIVVTNEAPYTRLLSADGTRFWEIKKEKQQVHIRLGKVGTNGQISVKTFASDEEADAAVVKLTSEQIGLGFKKIN